MLCDYCHQQEAIIHIQEIRPDGNKTFNLCAACALKNLMRLKPGIENLESIIGSVMGLFEGKDAKVRLEQIFNRSGDELGEEIGEDVECPGCHQKLSEFVRHHHLGCRQCATAFARYMRHYLEKKLNIDLPQLEGVSSTVQGAAVPADTEVFDADMLRQQELARLQRELACAVAKEDYEKAARLRDRIAEFTPLTDTGEEN